MKFLALAFLILGGCAALPPPTKEEPSKPIFQYARHYTIGEEYSYLLKRSYFQNGQWSSTGEALSHHVVFVRKGIFLESVDWPTYWFKNKNNPTGKDLGADAKAVGSYEISLDPQGDLKLPNLNSPSMTANLTDLNTFFVAISPHAGITHLQSVGDHFTGPLVLGNWGGTANTPLGEDCIAINLEFTALGESTAQYKTSFLPPTDEAGCTGFIFRAEWMKTPVVPGKSNNFQEVTRHGKRFDVMWGHEEFIVESTVDRISGKLLFAKMDNPLELRLKSGCDQNLQNCKKFTAADDSVPVKISRQLELKLLK